MGRPNRIPFWKEDIDTTRWPYIVGLNLNSKNWVYTSVGNISLSYQVVDWLHNNIKRGGWRFAKSESNGLELLFMNSNDAVAFRMRFG